MRSTAAGTAGLSELEWEPWRHIREEQSNEKNLKEYWFTLLIKKVGDMPLHNSCNPTYASRKRKYKRGKAALLHLAYPLLIGMMFLTLMPVEGYQFWLLSAKGLKTQTSKKEWWWQQPKSCCPNINSGIADLYYKVSPDIGAWDVVHSTFTSIPYQILPLACQNHFCTTVLKPDSCI